MQCWRAVLGALALGLVSTAGQAECQLGKMADIPITMRGRQPMTVAKINGSDVRFMVDSGAFWSAISPGVATENHLSLHGAPGGMTISGIGGRVDASVTTVKTLTVAGVDVPNVDFFVGGSEVGEAGVIGQNLLHLADVEYDLSHGSISLMRPKDCGGKSLAYWAGSQPFSMLPLTNNLNRYSHTTASIIINGHSVTATFDTGAGMTVISTAAAARIGIKPDSPGVVVSGFSRGIGSHMVKSWIIPVDDIKIGGEEVRRSRIYMSDLGGDTDMLIGADFFLAHHVYVANSQNRIYFTYGGGTFFNVGGQIAKAVDGTGNALDIKDAAADPTDAEGLSRRGAARLSQGNKEGALADLDQAVKLMPTEPRYYLQRAAIQGQLGHPLLVKADLDKALALKPDNVDALLNRAVLLIRFNQRGDAEQDVDAASRLLDAAADRRYMLAGLYEGLDQMDKAIGELDRWIAAHPEDSRRPSALNARCWTRALANRDLDKALSDCNAAIRAMPHKEAGLDSRALVHLRRGEFAEAIKDYTDALAIAPRQGWSLYCRGIAEEKSGQKEAGDKDIAAGLAIDARFAARAKKWGLAA